MSGTADYAIEPLDPARLADLAPLMKDAFGDTVDGGFFQWKYNDNPGGRAIGHIARHRPSGELAAFYGMIPELYRWGSERRRVYQSCDTMTHSGHRRKGLFQLLARHTYAGAQADDPGFSAFGFGGPTSTPGFVKMGWQVAFEVPYRFRPFPLTLLSSAASKRAKVRRLGQIDDQVVAMIRSNFAERAHGLEASDDFIRWRLANPLRRYQYWVDDDGAYAISYRNGDLLLVLDFWEASAGAGRHVWDAVRAESLSPRTKGVLTFAQPGTAYDRRLRDYGLLRNPFGRGPAADKIPFITLGDFPGESSFSDWSITPFDHDSF